MAGSKGQLRDTAELILGCFGHFDANQEARDKVLQGRGLRAEALSLRVFLIHPGAASILVGRFRVIESPDMLKKGGERRWVPRQPQSQHTGAVDLHISALHGVVIDEDKTVQRKIQLARERLDVLGLAAPVDPP